LLQLIPGKGQGLGSNDRKELIHLFNELMNERSYINFC